MAEPFYPRADTAVAPYTIEEFTAGDGYRWHYRRYPPSGPPRAHLVAIHGIQSHGGWYENSCRWLGERGYAVSFIDRRGSGLNMEARGDAPGFRRLLDDLAEFLMAARRGDGEARIPTFLLAISWGGKLATALQRRHPDLIDALVLLCPGFFAKVKPSRQQRLAILAARIVSPRKLFSIPLNSPDLFTATPHWQQFIAADPLGLRRATARLLFENVRLDGYLRFVARYVRAPVLLLLAEKDRIIDNERTRRFVDRFVSAERQIIEYPGAHHTLEFEPDPQSWLADVEGWLARQVKRGEPGA